MMFNSTGEIVLHGTAYLVAYFSVTVALLLCFVILLFSMSLLLELLGQTAHALLVGEQKQGAGGGI
jgi:hypothetical protein